MKFLSNILAKAGLIVDGTTQLNTVANATTDTDKFLVSDAGVVKHRTGAQVLSDIGAVPYTGATGNVNLGEYGITTGYLGFDLTPTGTPVTQGTMYWDATEETAALIMNGTTQHVGQDVFYRVKNSTGSPIAKGTAVRFAGTDGNSGHVLIAPFLANGTYPSQYFMGVTAEAIANGDYGKVMHFGKLNGINTNGYIDGDILYASTTVAGGFQTTVPQAPNNIVIVAAVISAANNGKILVRSTLGSNINNDEGVKITSPANNSVLAYNSTTGLWEDAVLSGLGGITGSGTTNYVPKFTSSSAIGNSLIYDNGTNVGIGTTSPTQKLTVNGDASFNGVVVGTRSGNANTVVGDGALTNSLASVSVGVGFNALRIAKNSFNTGVGAEALSNLDGGAANTAIGGNAGRVTNGSADVTSVNNSTYLGYGTTASAATGNTNETVIGFQAQGNGSNTVTLGNNSVTNTYLKGQVNIATINNATTDTDKFLVSDSGVIKYRTGAEILSDIGGQGALSLTTTGTSGAATLVGNTLNVPQYQAQGNYITSLTGEATGSGPGAASVTLSNLAVISKVLTGLNITGGTILATDSILEAFGKAQNQINGLFGGVTYQGTWNASTNTPTLTSSTGTKGHYYIVSTPGSTDLNGITDWKLGDWAIFNGSTWDKVDNTDAVVSVNGFTGAVSLTTSNISEGTNLYYTNARARQAISLTTTGTSGAATYDNSTGVLNIPQYQTALTNPVTGTGTTNYIAKWTSSSAVGNSQIFDNGTSVGINTITPSEKLEVSGIARISRTTSASVYLNLTMESGVAGYDARGSIDQVFYTNTLERLRIGFGGDITISTIANATTDTDKFLVSDGGVIKYRTGAELLSDIGGASAASFVPYTGATTTVNLGSNLLQAGSNQILGDNVSSGGYLGFKQFSGGSSGATGFTSLSALGTTSLLIDYSQGAGVTRGVTLSSALISNNTSYTYSFPNKGGTFALLDDITGSVSGTTNYIPKFTGANTIGNSQIIDNTNILINRTSSFSSGTYTGQKLQVTGGIGINSDGADGVSRLTLLGNSSTGDGTIDWGGNGNFNLVFSNNGSERMRLDASGNLGLGTSSPVGKLNVIVSGSGFTPTSTGAIGGASSTRFNLQGNEPGIMLSTDISKTTGSPTGTQTMQLGMQIGFYNVNDVRNQIYYGNGPLSFVYSSNQGTSVSEYMRLDASGNLGIGTSSPASKLDVLATYSSDTGLQQRFRDNTGVSLNFGGTGGGKKWIQAQDATGASTYYDIIINPLGGNLGLGVTPSAWFTVYRALQIGSYGAAISGQTNDQALTLWNNAYPNSSNVDTYVASAAANKFRMDGGAFAWYTAPSGTAGNAISFTQAMTLDASGRLGIGTTSPAYKLDVSSTAAEVARLRGTSGGGSNNTQLRFYGSASATDLWAIGTEVSTGTTGRAFDFYDLVANANRMRLDASGNLGLGVTPPSWHSSFKALSIAGSNGIGAHYTGSSYTAGMYSNAYASTSASTYYSQGTAFGSSWYNQFDGSHSWFSAPPVATTSTALTWTQTMTLDASGRLGIGTTSPGQTLSIRGGAFATLFEMQNSSGAATGYLGVASTSGNIFGTSSANDVALRGEGSNLLFGFSTTERMRITSGGNVGIGTTSITNGTTYGGSGQVNILKVSSNGYPALEINSITDGGGSLQFTHGTNAPNQVRAHIGYNSAAGAVLDFNINNVSNGAMTFGTNNAERMRITSGGNVGIGTTNPQSALSLAGGSTISIATTDGSDNSYMLISGGGAAGAGRGAGFVLNGNDRATYGGQLDLFTGDAATAYMTFSTGGSERMRITSGGEVLMNTTSTLTAGWLCIAVASNNYNAIVLKDTGTSYSSGNYYQVFTNSSNTIVGSISHPTATTVSFNTSSDYRLKTDFKDFSGLDLVSKIKAYDYEWKEDKTRSYGVIAHELQSVIPYAVTGVKDGKDMQGVDYSKLVPVLVQAIKDLKAEIETLKNK